MNTLNHRYIARVVLEAETPLFVGSGETSLLKDALVQKDNHGFPMIQGTSLTGVLRHGIEDASKKNKEEWQSFFGYQASSGKKGLGSQLKVSSAFMILDNGKVAEGLSLNKGMKAYQNYFDNLPTRQHVRIDEKGVAIDKGLFDNEVVFKGARFLFELELKGTKDDGEKWKQLLSELKSQSFRIGQGTRNGYGRLSVNSIFFKDFDLNNEEDFNKYLNFDSSLNAENSSLKLDNTKGKESNYTHYKLELNPEDFFIFSAGYGDDEADNIPVTEQVITYNDSNSMQPLDEKGETLIPASSIKGALSHRTAFHYNKLNKKFVDSINDEKYLEFLSSNNDAVFALFGAEEGHENRDGQRGRVIINDVFLTSKIVSNESVTES